MLIVTAVFEKVKLRVLDLGIREGLKLGAILPFQWFCPRKFLKVVIDICAFWRLEMAFQLV